MILYHGSNVEITEIDLSKGQKDKDFGQGFYLTDMREQAEAMARRRVMIAEMNGVKSDSQSGIVSSFEFDESVLSSGALKVLCFDKPTAEWADFIVKNRHSRRNGFVHDYDIVYGPVADDGVYDQIRRYEQGRISLEELADELKYAKLNNQYFFGTTAALQYLIKIS